MSACVKRCQRRTNKVIRATVIAFVEPGLISWIRVETVCLAGAIKLRVTQTGHLYRGNRRIDDTTLGRLGEDQIGWAVKVKGQTVVALIELSLIGRVRH